MMFLILVSILSLANCLPPTSIIVDDYYDGEGLPFPYDKDANWTLGAAEADPVDGSCTDPRYSCPGKMTCCMISKDKFGCCPWVEGTCCNDGKHCCPHNMKCDATGSRCLREKDGEVMIQSSAEVVEAILEEVEDFTEDCPSPNPCSEETTCCKMSGGDIGCCPYRNAVCCEDGEHCCPHGMKCDLAKSTCVFKNHYGQPFTYPWSPSAKKDLVEKVEDNDDDVGSKCIDPKQKCAPGQTCCTLEGGSFGCCPYPDAVCCKDQSHCCPHGTTCDVAEGRCERKLGAFLLETMFMGSLINADKTDGNINIVYNEDKLEDERGLTGQHKCPNGNDQCLDGQTCCLISDQEYGCCPLANATCCPDRIHCCPHGFVCNTEKPGCLPPSPTSNDIQVFDNIMAKKLKFRTPNHQSTMLDYLTKPMTRDCSTGQLPCEGTPYCCPEKETCCEVLASPSGWGCCGYPSAICCDDKVHCCPEGMECYFNQDVNDIRCRFPKGKNILTNLLVPKITIV